MPIVPTPSRAIFASAARPDEIQDFPDWNRGWGLTFDPGQTEGIPPMEWMNSAFNRISSATAYLLQRGVAPHSPDEDYQKDSVVTYNGSTWLAKRANKNVLPGTSSDDWTQPYDYSSRIGTDGSTSNRNRVINGGMSVDQWNNGNAYTDSTGASAFAIDRWRLVTRTGATIRAQRSVSSGGSTRNHLAVTIIAAKTPAATDQFRVTHAIEGVNVGDLWSGTAAAKTVTLSFETCHSVAGTYSGSLMNAAFDRSFVFTYTQNVANTWERKTITIALDKSGTWEYGTLTGLFVAFDYGSGSNLSTANVGVWQTGSFVRATSGTTLVSTVNAIFRIQAVQLEEGYVATPFEQKPHGIELVLCQRYFQGPYSTYLATTVEAANINKQQLPVVMRASPTVIGGTPTSGSGATMYATNESMYQQGINSTLTVSTPIYLNAEL